MKDDKGFTLVELIAVIVVLAIIALIAVPAVSNYLYEGEDSFYDSVAASLVASGRDYYSDFHSLLPKNDNEVREVDVEDLIKDGYLDRDKIINNKGETCGGTVYVKRLGNRDYSYCVLLKCNDKVMKNTCEDGESEEDTNVSEYEIAHIDRVDSIPQCYSYSELINKINEVESNREFVYNNKIIGKIKNSTTGQTLINNGEEIRVYPDESTLNLNALGIYKLNYEYSGAASKTTTITVVDTEPPVLDSIKMTFTLDDINGAPYDCNNDAQCAWKINSVVVKFYGQDLAQHNNCGKPGSGITFFYYELEDGQGPQQVTAFSVGNGAYAGYAKIDKTYKGTITVKAVDKAGHMTGIAQTRYLKIDKTKPICASNDGTTSWTGSDRRVTVTCADDHSGCSAPTFSTNYTNTTVTSKITISDNVGNTNDCDVNVYVDKTAPRCTTTSSASGNWTNQDVNIYGTCGDDHSGCQRNVSDGPFTAEQNTTRSPGRVCDNVNNCTTCDSIAVKIDKTKPTCDYSGGGTNWVTYRTVNYGCKDTSGSYNSGCTSGSNHSATYPTSLINPKVTTQTIDWNIYDVAGNSRSCSNTFNIYACPTAPVVPYPVTYPHDGEYGSTATWTWAILSHECWTGWYNCGDGTGDKLANTSGTYPVAPCTYSSNGNYTLTIYALAGNHTTRDNYVYTIDTTGPTGTVSASVSATRVVTITVSASDSGVGLHDTAYSICGGAWQASNKYTSYTPSTLENGCTVKVRDALGNTSSCTARTIGGCTLS